MRWRVDLCNSSGAAIGPGPITTAQQWESTARMDRAGTFRFTMSAIDPLAAYLAPLVIVRCYAVVGGAWTEVGSGIVERIQTQVDASGQAVLSVSGPDMLGELNNRHMAQRYIDGSTTLTSEPMTPTTQAVALQQINEIIFPPLWTMTPDSAPPVDSLVGRWNYETQLQAIISLAAKCRGHFYTTGFRSLQLASTFASSGVRAIAAPAGNVAAETCVIAQLSVIEDGADIVTGVIPFGGGNADARLTMLPKTTATPAGYTSPTATWYRPLFSTAGVAAYGRIERVVVWNDITPISSTDGDIQAAANALFEQALRYLQQHEAPARFYNLSLAEGAVLLRPMQTIRVVYRDVAQGVNIDEELKIIESVITLDAQGLRTTGLTVATIDRWPESDSGALVERLRRGQMYEAAPQLNANSYVISYTKPVDNAETATFRFRFDSEVVQLTRCTFDFQILPLESTVKSVAGTEVTTPAGGGGTSSESGVHTHTVTIGTHTHGVTIDSHTHSVTIGDHTHSVTIGDHTHSVSIGSHSHGIDIYKLDAADASNRAVYHQGSSNLLGVIMTGSGTYDTPTSNSGGASTPTTAAGGSSTPTTAAGGASTPTTAAGGASTPTTAAGGSSTPTSGNSTGHTHTIGDHTHTFTPTITATYGIFRETSGNTFALADIEYSVDGSTWYAFSVGVNGFANLGDGWYRVDITALIQNSTTLRPTTNNNAVRVRRKSTGAIKSAMIEAQLNVRTIIQAIAAL